MPPTALARVRKICLALPDAYEQTAWGAPTFRVNNRIFAMYAAANDHHGAGHDAVWVNCTTVNQSLMIGANPKRFFSPAYVGPSGWIGMRLDGRVSWKAVADVLRDGYDLTLLKSKRPRAAARTSRRPKAPRTKSL